MIIPTPWFEDHLGVLDQVSNEGTFTPLQCCDSRFRGDERVPADRRVRAVRCLAAVDNLGMEGEIITLRRDQIGALLHQLRTPMAKLLPGGHMRSGIRR